ncbi:MAG: hypothetical protein ACR2K5_04005 [Pseudolabrys sp.]
MTATQGRLRHVEANFAELNTERARLAASLDDINERHANELATQQMRYEALQARAGATERLLIKARDHLTTRSDEVRAFDRRMSETAQERDMLAAKVGGLEAERAQRESELREVQTDARHHGRARQRARQGLQHQGRRAGPRRGNRQALGERMMFLEAQVQATKQAAEQKINDLDAALRREKLERSVVEGALEAARKDFARLMREVMALQRQRTAEEPLPTLRSANAA